MVEKRLEDGDKKILVDHLNVRQSIAILLCKLLIIELFFLGLLALLQPSCIERFFPNINSTHFQIFNIPPFILLVFIKIYFVIYVILKWLYEYYEIFPHFIVHNKGVIFRHEERYSFNQIKAIKLNQGILGKIFNFGTIMFYDWQLNKETSMYLIHNPKRHFRILEDLHPKTSEERHILREHLDEDAD